MGWDSPLEIGPSVDSFAFFSAGTALAVNSDAEFVCLIDRRCFECVEEMEISRSRCRLE